MDSVLVRTVLRTYVDPIVSYCSPVWGVGYLGDLARLDKPVRYLTRLALDLGGLSYDDRRASLDILPLPDSLRVQDICTLHGVLKRGPDYASDYGVIINWRRTELEGVVSVGKGSVRTEVGRRSFLFRSADYWNDLPPDVRNIVSGGFFRQKTIAFYKTKLLR